MFACFISFMIIMSLYWIKKIMEFTMNMTSTTVSLVYYDYNIILLNKQNLKRVMWIYSMLKIISWLRYLKNFWKLIYVILNEIDCSTRIILCFTVHWNDCSILMRAGGDNSGKYLFLLMSIYNLISTFLRRRSAVSVLVDCGLERAAVWWVIKGDTRAVVAAWLNE